VSVPLWIFMRTSSWADQLLGWSPIHRDRRWCRIPAFGRDNYFQEF